MIKTNKYAGEEYTRNVYKTDYYNNTHRPVQICNYNSERATPTHITKQNRKKKEPNHKRTDWPFCVSHRVYRVHCLLLFLLLFHSAFVDVYGVRSSSSTKWINSIDSAQVSRSGHTSYLYRICSVRFGYFACIQKTIGPTFYDSVRMVKIEYTRCSLIY